MEGEGYMFEELKTYCDFHILFDSVYFFWKTRFRII